MGLAGVTPDRLAFVTITNPPFGAALFSVTVQVITPPTTSVGGQVTLWILGFEFVDCAHIPSAPKIERQAMRWMGFLIILVGHNMIVKA